MPLGRPVFKDSLEDSPRLLVILRGAGSLAVRARWGLTQLDLKITTVPWILPS